MYPGEGLEKDGTCADPYPTTRPVDYYVCRCQKDYVKADTCIGGGDCPCIPVADCASVPVSACDAYDANPCRTHFCGAGTKCVEVEREGECVSECTEPVCGESQEWATAENNLAQSFECYESCDADNAQKRDKCVAGVYEDSFRGANQAHCACVEGFKAVSNIDAYGAVGGLVCIAQEQECGDSSRPGGDAADVVGNCRDKDVCSEDACNTWEKCDVIVTDAGECAPVCSCGQTVGTCDSDLCQLPGYECIEQIFEGVCFEACLSEEQQEQLQEALTDLESIFAEYYQCLADGTCTLQDLLDLQTDAFITEVGSLFTPPVNSAVGLVASSALVGAAAVFALHM
jgi:hypothetical protein